MRQAARVAGAHGGRVGARLGRARAAQPVLLGLGEARELEEDLLERRLAQRPVRACRQLLGLALTCRWLHGLFLSRLRELERDACAALLPPEVAVVFSTRMTRSVVPLLERMGALQKALDLEDTRKSI